MAVYRYSFSGPFNVGGGAAWTIPGSVSTGQVNLTSAGVSRILRSESTVAAAGDPPVGSVIVGLELRVRRRFSGTGAADSVVRLVKGEVNLANLSTGATLPSGFEVATFGGPSSLIGTSWSLADIPQIGFEYQAVYTPGTPGTCYVDGVELGIYCAQNSEEDEGTTMTRYLNDVATVYLQLSRNSTGEAADATGTPTYRVYEEATNTPISTGNLSLLDDAGTVGLYVAQISLTAGAGFEVGKTYAVRALATVDGISTARIVDRFVIRNAVGDEVWGATRTAATSATPTTYGPMVDLLLKFFINRYRKQGDTVTLHTDGNTPLLTQDFSVNSTGFDRGRAQ